MKQTAGFSKIHFVLFLTLITSVLLPFPSCSVDDITSQPKGNYIKGFAIFVDTNFISTGGHYGLALYAYKQDPFLYQPVTVQTIDCTNPVNYYNYRVNWSGTGNYYCAIVWVRDNGGLPVILGTYGCDTCHTCSSHKVIAFPNYSGSNYNITCWNDTTHALH